MNYLPILWLTACGVLICCTRLAHGSDVSASSIDETLADFDFETPTDTADVQQPAAAAERRADLDTLADIDIDDAGDDGGVQSGRHQNAFAIKEQRIRLALQRATKEGAFTRKFAQILPIMRSLNAQQRLVLASLITAQSTADAGKALDLKQVESMFGERRSLILPILFDIANLIKNAAVSPGGNSGARHARTLLEDITRVPAVELMRHSYIPLQAAPVKRAAIADNTTAPVASMLRDDRLHVDDTDDVLTTRNLVVRAQHHEERRSLKAQDAPETRPRSNDQRSYHERKLNMTNFNATTGDQFAMESEGVPIRITLPRSPMSRPSGAEPQAQQQVAERVQPQMTLEQYEELALRDLNDTVVDSTAATSTSALATAEDEDDDEDNDAHSSAPMQQVRNETTGELLPLPEMLISRYRNKNNPNRKLLAAGSNGLETSAARHCERFGSLCLRVEDYPMQAIMGSIRRHKHAMSALLAEYIDKDDIASTKALNDEAKRREDDELTPSGMCPSVIRYARPQKARSATGEWKYIVNTGQHTQTLRLEKCTKVEESCTYLTDNFRSRCVQVFNYHRLLSWDNARGLHIDIFKVPTCCSCHIDSYKEKFPPIISSYNGLQDDYRFSASSIQPLQHQTQPSVYQHHRHHTSPYTTILSGNEPQLDDDTSAAGSDDEESIAYQYSNGFKRSPGKQHHKYRDSSVGATSNKPVRFEKPHKSVSPQQSFAAISPTLDSYLTPPTSESEFDFVSPFKRGGTAGTAFVGDASLPDIGSVSASSSQQQQRNRNRRPVRTNNRDQTIAGSDFLPDHSVLPPSHTDPHHPSPVNTAYTSSAAGVGHPPAATAVHNRQQQQQQPVVTSAAVPGVASVTSTSYAHGPHPQLLLTTPHHQLPSISTASTSAVDLGKRVNYNYHPIIDFFGDAMRADKQEIEDRVGVGGGGGDQQRTWRPSHGPLAMSGGSRRVVHRP